MKKRIPTGTDNFSDIINSDFYYVDKTKIIEDLLYEGNKVFLFPRPRRFGKSLFISMLEHFFDVDKREENTGLFKGLYIEKSKYYEVRNTYPVINIDFKELKQDTFQSVFNQFKMMIESLYVSKIYVYDSLLNSEKIYFDKIQNGEASEDEYKQSIKKLSDFLYKYHHKKVIILIDEYDVPVQQGYIKDFYEEVISFIRSVMSSCLKGNDSLYMGVLTGVLRVSKESIFSDLNNLKVYSIMDKSYSEYFGFTKEETKELLEYYDLEYSEEIKEMYDGYNFGGVSIYNPWSILNYASDKELRSYWVNTSGNDLIKKLLLETTEGNKKQIEELVLERDLAFVYNDKITYMDFNDCNNLNNILNLLFISGYLTLSREEINEFNEKEVYLKIPNKEVKELITTIMTQVKYSENTNNLLEIIEFNKALLNNEKEKIESILNEMFLSIDIMDYQEYFYHAYTLGLFKAFLDSKMFILKSNKSAGEGRLDVMIEKTDRSKGFVIEFKLARSESKMEELANLAKRQMREKEYYKELANDKVENIYEYAIVFYGKKCIVR